MELLEETKKNKELTNDYHACNKNKFEFEQDANNSFNGSRKLGGKNSNSNYENSKLMFLSNHFFFCIWGLPHITSSAKGEGGKKSREIEW